MMDPKISVIVPVYNVEPYLKKCIDSILAQSFKDIEIILVNDGSPDNCGPICDEYAKLDSRIRVIHKENGGLASARNTGLRLAKGQYIGFIDSDDYIDKDMYEILYDTIEAHSSDIVVCDVIKVNPDSNNNYIEDSNTDYRIEHFSTIQAFNQLYQPNEKMFDTMGRRGERWIFAVNKLYKKSLFQSLSYKEGVIYDDEFLIHKLYYQAEKVTSISAKLYYYLQRPNSIANSPYSIKKFDRIYALKERADFFKSINQNSLHEKAFKVYLEVFIWSYLAARSQLTGVDKELKGLKKTLNRSIVSLIRNSYTSWKQKLMVILFIFSPNLYCLLVKERRQLKAS